MKVEEATFRVTVGQVPPVRVIPRNETPTAKQYRVTVALVREFVKEFPEDALKIVRELVPGVVK